MRTVLPLAFLSAGNARAEDTRTVPAPPQPERAWIRRNPDKLVLWFNTEFPPIEFVSDSGEFVGLGADIIALVEKRLDVTFRKEACSDWNAHLAALESGECAIAPTIVASPERERYAFFTLPYATAPVAIIANGTLRGTWNLRDLVGRRVAVVSGFASEGYLRAERDLKLELVTMPNVPAALRATSFGQVDAYVENLAVAAYYVQKEGIPNLRVVGSTPYEFAWSIAISKQYPLLAKAVSRALASIPPEEMEAARRRWISPGFGGGWWSPETVRMLAILAAFVALLACGFAIMAYALRRRLREKVASLAEAQRKIADQAAFLSLGMEVTQAGMWDFAVPQRSGFLSAQWFRMLGYDREGCDMPADEMERLVHPDDRPILRNAFASHVGTGGKDILEIEMRLLQADGDWCWVLSKGRTVAWDERGTPTRIIGLTISIQSGRDAQEKLRQSEAKFRAVFENAPYPIVINDLATTRLLDANQAALESMGARNPAEAAASGMADRSRLGQDQKDGILAQLAEEGKVIGYEAEVAKPDGSTGHIVFSSVLMETGKGRQILSMIVDITERKRMEVALRQSEELFRVLLLNAPVPLVLHSTDGRILAMNNAMAHTFGYVLEDIPDLDHWFALAYPDPDYRECVRTAWRESVDRALATTGQTDPVEYYVTCKEGTVRRIRFSATVVEDRVIVGLYEVTALREKEEALRESTERLRATLNATNDGIMVLGGGGRVVLANQQFHAMWDTPAELRNAAEGVAMLDHAGRQVADPQRFQALAHSLTDSGRTDVFEVTLADGRAFEVYSAPVLLSGTETGRVWDCRDITTRKRLQDQLLQAQKMDAIGTLAGGVAHDFNNMLGGIMGHVELAMGELADGDPTRKTLRKVLDIAERSANLTRQLLAFARKEIISPRVFEINTAVEDLLKMLRRLIGENIELLWHPDPGMPCVELDPSQLDQVLANLCVNARDAIGGNGRITIQVCPREFADREPGLPPECAPGRYVALSVADTGHGMDAETLSHVFEPFFTTKEPGKGTGLGLATVYGIVHQNGGFVEVESQPGEGSCFTVVFPRSTAAPTRSQSVRKEIARGKGETVLLVEDNPVLLDTSSKMLQKLGYRVLAAAGPSEALGLAGGNSADIRIILADVVMPEMNGRELSERVLEICPTAKCLFMSGYTADVIVHQGVVDEGLNFIQKPFPLHALAAKIRSVLEGR